MRRSLKDRVRLRVIARMDELGMSGRELAQSIRPRPPEEDPDEWTQRLDSWISSILTGRAGLGLEYFDATCETLRLTPSELVREDTSELRELTPTEMRLLRHYQQWPRAVQDRWIKMLEYFTSATNLEPDKSRLLDEWEELTTQQKQELQGYLFALRRERIQQRAERDGARMATDEGAASRDATPLGPEEQTRPASRAPNDDPNDG